MLFVPDLKLPHTIALGLLRRSELTSVELAIKL